MSDIKSHTNHNLWRRHFLSPEGLIRLVVLALAIIIIIAVVIFRSQFSDLEGVRRYGYIGVLLVNLIGSASLVLPVPSLAAVFAAGAFLNPLAVGLLAGAGQAVGELTGYMLGYSGQTVFENRKRYIQLRDWMMRRGTLALFVLSAIPNPLFDVAGAAAGALRFPLWKFLLAIWLGKTLKSLIFAFAGALGVPLLLEFFS